MLAKTERASKREERGKSRPQALPPCRRRRRRPDRIPSTTTTVAQCRPFLRMAPWTAYVVRQPFMLVVLIANGRYSVNVPQQSFSALPTNRWSSVVRPGAPSASIRPQRRARQFFCNVHPRPAPTTLATHLSRTRPHRSLSLVHVDALVPVCPVVAAFTPLAAPAKRAAPSAKLRRSLATATSLSAIRRLVDVHDRQPGVDAWQLRVP